jgi:antirestriction protein ArdC
VLPSKDAFFSPEGYYGTFFHELVHSTGHKSRLDRNIMNAFGNEEYSKEELVAEMGAAALCLKCNINNQIEYSVDYLRGWVKQLNDDPHLIVQASSQAQKAVDYILGELP